MTDILKRTLDSDNEPFMGVPVLGTISRNTEAPVEQYHPQKLIDLLNELLQIEHVEALRWEQYTPYFNDGDACIFGINEITVKLDFAPHGGDYENGFLSSYSLWEYANPGDRDYTKIYRYNSDGLLYDTEEICVALERLEKALPHHLVNLNKYFGDPAQITYNGEEFDVEYYEHD